MVLAAGSLNYTDYTHPSVVIMSEAFQVQKCLRYNDAGTFEGKVFELTAKAIAACKETIQFARMMSM